MKEMSLKYQLSWKLMMRLFYFAPKLFMQFLLLSGAIPNPSLKRIRILRAAYLVRYASEGECSGSR